VDMDMKNENEKEMKNICSLLALKHEKNMIK
jgi:hypothetical protein